VLELWPAASVRTHTLPAAARTIQWRVAEGATAPRSLPMSDRVLWLAETLDQYREQAPRPVHIDADDFPDPHSGARHTPVLTGILTAVNQLTGPLLD